MTIGEHAHRLILVCEHLQGRVPDVLWIDNGEVQAAVCFACADEVEAKDNADVPAMKTICVTCARMENIPIAAKMDDGFYDRRGERGENGEQWVKRFEVKGAD
jgi:hypothetical protein